MASHGYDDDFGIVDADDSWNQYDPYVMRRAPQQPAIHMTQQMTTKVAPAYDGRTSFFAFEDAVDGWCDIKTWTCIEEQIRKVMHLNTKYYWTESCWETQTMVWTISKDSCDPISSREPKPCSCIDSCSSWSTTEEQWIYRDGWPDFNSQEIDSLSLGWISYVIWRLPVQKQLRMLRSVAKLMKLIRWTKQALQQLLQVQNHMSMYLGQMSSQWQHFCNSTKTEG